MDWGQRSDGGSTASTPKLTVVKAVPACNWGATRQPAEGE